MTAAYNLRTLIFMGVCGVGFLALGLVLFLNDSMIMQMKMRFQKHYTLEKGRIGYNTWLTPVDMVFKFYLFHVNNPEGVMQGETPIFTEKGPYVYAETVERQILSIDEESDEIVFMTRSMFAFNKRESGNVTEDDKVTILNPAYLGTINTLAALSADFLKQFGDSIAKLFPPSSVVFVSGKAGDILFSGMKFTCNSKKYSELKMICSTLESNKPPIVIDGPKAGTYFYSFFQKINSTLRGPYRVKRGVTNYKEVGTISMYQGKRIQKIWDTKPCNTVNGSDGITWAPMPMEILDMVSLFSPDTCRNMPLYYQRHIIINGMVGALYTLTSKTWEPDEIDCYCPQTPDGKVCLPKGILDIGQCQELPIFLSEPHFMHGDPALLQYAQGLKPQESIDGHQSYVIIEPLTGAPLSGFRRTQLSIKLSRHATVELLQNVSEGYFPLLWCEEGKTPELPVLARPFQAIRLLHLAWFMQLIPLIIGVYLLLMTLYACGIAKRKTRVTSIVRESLAVSQGSFVRTMPQGPPRRHRRLFE